MNIAMIGKSLFILVLLFACMNAQRQLQGDFDCDSDGISISLDGYDEINVGDDVGFTFDIDYHCSADARYPLLFCIFDEDDGDTRKNCVTIKDTDTVSVTVSTADLDGGHSYQVCGYDDSRDVNGCSDHFDVAVDVVGNFFTMLLLTLLPSMLIPCCIVGCNTAIVAGVWALVVKWRAMNDKKGYQEVNTKDE